MLSGHLDSGMYTDGGWGSPFRRPMSVGGRGALVFSAGPCRERRFCAGRAPTSACLLCSSRISTPDLRGATILYHSDQPGWSLSSGGPPAVFLARRHCHRGIRRQVRSVIEISELTSGTSKFFSRPTRRRVGRNGTACALDRRNAYRRVWVCHSAGNPPPYLMLMRIVF